MNEKNKINGGSPDDDIPRLVNWAARTQEGVDTMLNALESQPLDAEFIALLHNVQSEEIQGYLYRGYTILTKGNQNNTSDKALCLARSTKRNDGNKLPIVWLFSGMFYSKSSNFSKPISKFHHLFTLLIFIITISCFGKRYGQSMADNG